MRVGVVGVAMAVVAIGIAGIAWLVLREGSAPAAAPSRGGGGRPSPAKAVAAERSQTAADSSRALAVARTDALAEEWNDATHDVIGPIVEGTIVVMDQDGVTHAEEDGAFLPDFFDGIDADSGGGDGAAAPVHARRRVAVKQGRFRFDACGAEAMLIEEAEFGGRAAVVDAAVDLTLDAPVKVKARWIDDVLLHVIDAKTRRDLSDVTLCAGRGYDVLVEHPGLPDLLTIVLEHERSPFHMRLAKPTDAALINGPIWVGARGHAWKREAIDFAHERNHEVALGPAGALSVVVTEPADAMPLDRRMRPRVRLRHVDGDAGAPICDVAAEAGEFELGGLAPGDVIAAIEVGDTWLTPLVISRAEVSIRADAMSRVTLSLDAGLAPKPTRLSGIAFIPPSWGWEEMVIDLLALNLRGGTRDDERRSTRIAPAPIPGRPGWHEWSISPILPARYRVRVERAGFETLVDVGEKGLDDVILTLPDPAILHVQVVNAETREDVTPFELGWLFTDSSNPNTALLRRDVRSGRCSAAVRPGRGKFLVVHRGSADPLRLDPNEEFDVKAGANELVVHAEPPCGVDLVASIGSDSDDPVRIVWSRPGTDWIDAARGVVDVKNGRSRVGLPGPGLYRFVRRWKGEEREELLFEIDVRKGEFIERTITLDR